MEESRSEHILELSKELLDDIELSRINAESLILKASRLARWVGSDEIRNWLKFEMSGYNSSNEISLKYMGKTGRWLNREKNQGFWGPLAQQEAAIEAEKAKLACMRTPDSSGEWASVTIRNVSDQMNQTTINITRYSGIKTRVLSILHAFVTSVYYEKQFDNLSESIFEKYKKDVDTLLGTSCGEIIEQIPSVMDRLAEGDKESISQSLVTCRRVIEAFADNIFPPSEEKILINGNELSLGENKHQNRINAYIHQRITSKSREKRFRQNLSNLFDRVSTGIHNDVSYEEARALFLNMYLLLGEILHLDVDANNK